MSLAKASIISHHTSTAWTHVIQGGAVLLEQNNVTDVCNKEARAILSAGL